MPQYSENAQQQFNAVEELLTRWLKERRTVLARYTEIAFSVDSDLSDKSRNDGQKNLCQLLVDYVSSGHFEVFHQLINEAETFADGSGELAENIMPAIGDTTEVIMAYDEKYSGNENYPETLSRDLSALGEVLESRFMLEDRLIAGLHNTHRR